MTDYDAIHARRERLLAAAVDEAPEKASVLGAVAGTSASTARRDLETLIELGFTTSLKLGRTVYYSSTTRAVGLIRAWRSQGRESVTLGSKDRP